MHCDHRRRIGFGDREVIQTEVQSVEKIDIGFYFHERALIDAELTVFERGDHVGDAFGGDSGQES
ncbi:hypothetical protein D3C87_2086620 [compost metagenome]